MGPGQELGLKLLGVSGGGYGLLPAASVLRFLPPLPESGVGTGHHPVGSLHSLGWGTGGGGPQPKSRLWVLRDLPAGSLLWKADGNSSWAGGGWLARGRDRTRCPRPRDLSWPHRRGDDPVELSQTGPLQSLCTSPGLWAALRWTARRLLPARLVPQWEPDGAGSTLTLESRCLA